MSASISNYSQDKIVSGKIARMAVLSGAGAKVGLNYLKYYGRSAIQAVNHEKALALKEELDHTNASTVYETFTKLKGGPLKVAQMLSIDQNLLPPAYAQQFAQAQSSVPPLSYPLVAQTFLKEFGKLPEALFDDFEKKAAHGASIGQVHQARIGNQLYAVKIQYPGVRESLKNDLRLVKPFALYLLGLREDDIDIYFQEIEARLTEETDYEHELKRATELIRGSSHLKGLRFPTYYPELSSKRILTTDWIDGESLLTFANKGTSQKERDQIGQFLWDFYHHQVHDLLLFHADPHPGNFLVRDGELCVLDFGCTKKITSDFHRRQFQFVMPGVVENETLLEEALRQMEVILPKDSPTQVKTILNTARIWVELLARPFRKKYFDFGDPNFLKAIYELGEESKKAKDLRAIKGKRGSSDTVYVNRTFFGLYSILGLLRARVRITLPF